ncbi:MAG: hypothetical protein JXR83_15930 [Deltaproteobacteria bacterium]|nr:hypothetical protein [Deltaproteobacteria bacterium]
MGSIATSRDTFGGEANPVERQAVADAAEAAAPTQLDWNNMTQDQKYDYLQKLTVANAGGDASAWKTGDRELNLVGVRGFSDGQVNGNEKDRFNDTIFACRMVDGKKEVYEYKASTDPGADPNGRWHDKGDAFLADGFYRDTWSKGTVSGNEQGLRQENWVNANIDYNGNGKIEGAETYRWKAGTDCQFQFHRGASGENVGNSSAGCQVIQGQQYDDFQKLLNEAPDGQKFSYLLINGSQLPTDANAEFTKSVGTWTKGVGSAEGHGCYDRYLLPRLSRGLRDIDDPHAGLGSVDPIEDPYIDEQRPDINGDSGIGIIQVPDKTPPPPSPRPPWLWPRSGGGNS